MHPFKRTIKQRRKVAKIPTVSSLTKKLDAIFSIYIRLRKADKNGMVKCYTCGKLMHYTEAQAGHFQSRRHYALRHNETNVQNQCVSCNIFNQGNQYQFGENLKKEYGEKAVEILMLKKNNHTKYDCGTLMILIQSYTQKVKALKEKLTS